MEQVRGTAYARAGLLGNPSDGYGGKAIGISFSDFRARVHLGADPVLSTPGLLSEDRVFQIHLALQEDLPIVDSEDGTALLEASLRCFLKMFPDLAERNLEDPASRFSLYFETDIPRQVGLAGSSAIVIACLRALDQRFATGLSDSAMAEMALRAETHELGIAAGPMDRVVQAVERMVVMDFAEPGDCSTYQILDEACLPELFVAWDLGGGRPSGEAHGDLRRRWEQGDPEVRAAMAGFRDLVDEGQERLASQDFHGFREVMDRNFDLRCQIFDVGERDQAMVAMARRYGAGVKLCGSGGAVIGSPRSEEDFRILERRFREHGCGFIRPRIRASKSTHDEGADAS